MRPQWISRAHPQYEAMSTESQQKGARPGQHRKSYGKWWIEIVDLPS